MFKTQTCWVINKLSAGDQLRHEVTLVTFQCDRLLSEACCLTSFSIFSGNGRASQPRWCWPICRWIFKSESAYFFLYPWSDMLAMRKLTLRYNIGSFRCWSHWKACKTLEFAMQKCVVWMAVLHRLCIDNTLFLPSSPPCQLHVNCFSWAGKQISLRIVAWTWSSLHFIMRFLC